MSPATPPSADTPPTADAIASAERWLRDACDAQRKAAQDGGDDDGRQLWLLRRRMLEAAISARVLGEGIAGPAPLVSSFAAVRHFYIQINGRRVKVTNRALIANPHSGDGQRVAVGAGRVWAVWASTDPPASGNGTACWAIELDDSGRELGRWEIGTADPARADAVDFPHKPDAHSQPQIFRDDAGTLHLLLGAHHGTLLYAQSKSRDTLADGLTDWVEIGDTVPSKPRLGYTYPAVAIVDGVLHVVARWSGTHGPYTVELVHFTYDPAAGLSPPHTVIAQGPPQHIYAVFYHAIEAARPALRVAYHTHYYTDDNRQVRPGDTPRVWGPE